MITSGLAWTTGGNGIADFGETLPGDLLPAASASTSGDNDAGSGGDASDDRGAPTRLPGQGQFEGRVADSSDADWFGLTPESSTLCVEARASAKMDSDVQLGLQGAAQYDAFTHLPANEERLLALAGTGLDDLLLGLNPTEKARSGKYLFDLQTYTVDELTANGDGGSGGDAGDTLATAVPLSPGCLGGSLSGELDTRDVYSFTGTAGHYFQASLAHASGSSVLAADLVDPQGNTVATIGSDEKLEVELDQDGTWSIQVYVSSSTAHGAGSLGPSVQASAGAASTDDDYLMSTTEDPDPPGCAPSCGSVL